MEDNLSRYLETESSEGSGGRDFAQTISINPSAVVRIVAPESVVKCWRMWPLCDDGKKRPYIIANDFEGDSLLAKMLGDYLPYKYFKGGILESERDELSGQKRYIYEQQDPELFFRLCYNDDKSSNNGSWRPTRDFIFNAIDRKVENEGDYMGQFWCVVHKHTKLLRMPITGFEKLKTLIEQHGRLDEYDIFYEKTGRSRNTNHNLTKAGEKNQLAYFGFLTEEEKAYERYDLKKECALSSATYALKYLSPQIERISSILGIDYISQFEVQSKQEKELWGVSDEENAQELSQLDPNVTHTQYIPGRIPQSSIPESVPQVAQAAQVTQVPVSPAPQPVVQPPVQPFVQSSVQAQVDSTPLPQNTEMATPQQLPVRGRVPIVSAEPTVPVITCPYCQAKVPDNIEVCSNCNNRLMEPCQKCQTMFSILATKCPNEKCGAVYSIESNN